MAASGARVPCRDAHPLTLPEGRLHAHPAYASLEAGTLSGGPGPRSAFKSADPGWMAACATIHPSRVLPGTVKPGVSPGPGGPGETTRSGGPSPAPPAGFSSRTREENPAPPEGGKWGFGPPGGPKRLGQARPFCSSFEREYFWAKEPLGRHVVPSVSSFSQKFPILSTKQKGPALTASGAQPRASPGLHPLSARVRPELSGLTIRALFERALCTRLTSTRWGPQAPPLQSAARAADLFCFLSVFLVHSCGLFCL